MQTFLSNVEPQFCGALSLLTSFTNSIFEFEFPPDGNRSMAQIANRRRRVTMVGLLSSAGLIVCVLVALLVRMYQTGEVTVNWGASRQTIDGFGASATGYIDGVTTAQADQWFSPRTGIGLSLLRVKLIPDTLREDCGCVANNTPYACAVGSKSQIVSGDMQVAQLAAERGVRVFASSWSPPASMKSSHQYCGGGKMIGTLANYSAYADSLASFPALMQASGITIYAISLQNEPDMSASYDTCLWTPHQLHDFIPWLSGALRSAGRSGVLIAAPEESTWDFGMLDETMGDKTTSPDVGLLLGHAYRTENPVGLPAVGDLHVWQSEVSDFGNFDGGMKDALRWARSINDYMTAGANAWLYWDLDCGTGQFNNKNNMCLTDQNRNLAKRAYVLGHYAKFIRPGWQRVDVTNHGSLMVTAYEGPSRQFAIVAINDSSWSAPAQAFRLNGLASRQLQITPWLTSSSASLAPQPPFESSAGGSSFSYTIPAESIVTFVGHAD
jgi:glucuronoarabinoxylan endo-1,4-beta-xylanase